MHALSRSGEARFPDGRGFGCSGTPSRRLQKLTGTVSRDITGRDPLLWTQLSANVVPAQGTSIHTLGPLGEHGRSIHGALPHGCNFSLPAEASWVACWLSGRNRRAQRDQSELCNSRPDGIVSLLRNVLHRDCPVVVICEDLPFLDVHGIQHFIRCCSPVVLECWRNCMPFHARP